MAGLVLNTKLTHPVDAAVAAKAASVALQSTLGNLAANRLKDSEYKERYKNVSVPAEMVKALVDAIVALRVEFDIDPAAQETADAFDAATHLAAQFTDGFGLERG